MSRWPFEMDVMVWLVCGEQLEQDEASPKDTGVDREAWGME